MDESKNGSDAEGRARDKTATVRRLFVTAEADPGALARVLERFCNVNLVPRRVVAELSGCGMQLHICVDITGMSDEELTRVTRKVGQVPSVVNAFWHSA